jgi:hypothetical protein
MEYEVELTAEDIGEMVTIIRVQHLRMHVQPFAEKIGMMEKVLLAVEDGNGPHGLLTLKKIAAAFPNVRITVNVDLK